MNNSPAPLLIDISGGLGTLAALILIVLVVSAFIRWLLKPR